MSQNQVKLLLTNANIPLIYEQVGRANISNADAAPRMPGLYSGDFINTDYGQPELIYAENVMPYAKGIYSVGFYQQVAAITGPATTACDQYISLRDASENIRAFVPAAGANYVYNAGTATWASVNPFTFVGSLVTRAYVAGRTFICYEKNRIIEYNVGTGLFTTIALTYPGGITIANVRGIGSASNYLLFFTDFAVYWCSPLNVLEFADINQGAGQSTPLDIKGQITALIATPGGFIVYTARNAIGATFTNNAAAPFVFKEINNAGGVASWERVTPEADEQGHYIYGTNGIQLVGLSRAVTLFPEVTDFLVSGQSESWNASTKTVDLTTVGSVSVKLAFLAGRFLVISYGAGTTYFSYALIYDTMLKRWGKIKLTHVDAFMYSYQSGTGAYTYDTLPGNYSDLVGDYAALGLFFLSVAAPKLGMAFLQNDGTIQVLQSNFNQTNDAGVALFGRIQNRHGIKTTIHDVRLDGIRTTPAVAVNLLSSQSGDERDTVTPMQLTETTGTHRRFSKRVTAENFDVAVEGTFILSALLVGVANGGSR